MSEVWVCQTHGTKIQVDRTSGSEERKIVRELRNRPPCQLTRLVRLAPGKVRECVIERVE